jgi:hypothetical protein
MDDMAEFIVFLKSYPHVSREPYSEYLFMEKCMFGRQAEMDKIMGFLLKPEPPGGAQGLQVLPVIGPPRVGKSTDFFLFLHFSFLFFKKHMVRKIFCKTIHLAP